VDSGLTVEELRNLAAIREDFDLPVDDDAVQALIDDGEEACRNVCGVAEFTTMTTAQRLMLKRAVVAHVEWAAAVGRDAVIGSGEDAAIGLQVLTPPVQPPPQMLVALARSGLFVRSGTVSTPPPEAA
jgi:hypothetical protein